jgi:hypothetical protein
VVHQVQDFYMQEVTEVSASHRDHQATQVAVAVAQEAPVPVPQAAVVVQVVQVVSVVQIVLRISAVQVAATQLSGLVVQV